MAPSSIVATSLDLEYIFKRTTDDRSAPQRTCQGRDLCHRVRPTMQLESTTL